MPTLRRNPDSIADLCGRTPRAAVTGALALVLLAGCASEPAPGTSTTGAASSTPSSPQAAGQPGPSITALQRAAVKQAAAPDPSSQSLPVPPGLDPADVAPVSGAADAQERLSLAEALKQFEGPLPNSEPPPKTEPPSEDSRRQALRLYSSARSRLYRGDSGAAIVDLESATRLDPMAPAPWRELGEAQLQQGKRLSAMQSFQQAVARGSREPRVLWLLGRDALRAGRTRQAVQYLAAARVDDDDGSDPALPNLIETDLADALRQLGLLRASAEALSDGLDLPDQLSTTRMRIEVGEFLRRRSDLLRDLGDALCRLGDYAPALDAYAQAAQSPTLDPSSVIPRQVFALMRLGRPAQAALLLVEEIHDSRGWADERVLALIPHVASSGSVSKDLAGAMGELAGLLRQDVSPTAADRLVRAQAAAAAPADARAILRRHIAGMTPSVSGNPAAVMQLLATFEPGDAQGQVRELLAIVDQTPLRASLCAVALLNSPADLDRVLAALPTQGGTDSQALLRAWVLSALGQRNNAADLVTDRKWSERSAPAGAFAETVLNAQIGRWQKAQAAFDRPAVKGSDPTIARLRSHGAMALQRPDEAMKQLEPLVTPASDNDRTRVDDLVEAGRLAGLLGNGTAAESFFKRAIAADAFDERAYDGLVHLYMPDGALADPAKVGDAARALRESCPSSRSLRLNAAEELAQRQLDAQAEQLLTELAEEDLSDGAAGSMLVALWERRAQAAKTAAAREQEKPRLERAESWLRARIALRPEQPWLWTGLARVLTAQGRADEAEKTLADRLNKRPLAPLAQTRESILRDPLGRGDDADKLALARLEPAPRSLDATAELADLYARLKRNTDAAGALKGAIPPGTVLTDSQTARLVLMLLRVSQGGAAGPADPDGALALFDAVAESKVRLPPQLHEARLAILTSRSKPDDRAIAAAVDLAAGQHPALAAEFYTRVAATFDESTDGARRAKAIPYLRLAIQKSAAPSTRLLSALVRLTVVVGTDEDIRLLIEEFDDPDRIASTLREFDVKAPSEPARARAEFAYTIANFLASQDRPDQAARLYRQALAFDPDHAWSKNNLGYQILESGGDMSEATRLLEGAYAGLPQESSVIDSLAWLRYKVGALEDQAGADGTVERQGAISLLRLAAATEKGAKNATIFDHLGDALWAAGRREEAAKAWAQASAIAEAQLATLRRDGRANRLAEEAAAKELQAILRKQKSLADGQEPSIAPRAPDR